MTLRSRRYASLASLALTAACGGNVVGGDSGLEPPSQTVAEESDGAAPPLSGDLEGSALAGAVSCAALQSRGPWVVPERLLERPAASTQSIREGTYALVRCARTQAAPPAGEPRTLRETWELRTGSLSVAYEERASGGGGVVTTRSTGTYQASRDELVLALGPCDDPSAPRSRPHFTFASRTVRGGEDTPDSVELAVWSSENGEVSLRVFSRIAP